MRKGLRIGNYVDLGNRIGKVIEISTKYCVIVDLEETQDTIEDYDRVKPINLTEEILLKCGFEWVKEVSGYCDKNHCVFLFSSGVIEFHPFCTNDEDCHIKIKNLHTLQNLIHALTGQELEVNL